MSDQPSAFWGQPNASAKGFHIAITIGLVTKEGVSVAFVPINCRPPYLVCHCEFNCVSQTLSVGLHISGFAFPERISCIDWSDSFGVACIVIGPSQALIFRLLKTLTASSIQACISGS